MIKEIFTQNKWFSFYTYFFIFNAIVGFFTAHSLVRESPYLAFMAALIFMGISVYFLFWLMWLVILIYKTNIKLEEAKLVFSEETNNIDEYAKTVRKKLILSTILWFLFLVVLFWYISSSSISTTHHEDSLNLLSVVFISWPVFLLSIKYKLSNISNTDFQSKEKVFKYASKYSFIVSLGIPVVLFFREITILFSTIFFLILTNLI